MSDGWRDVIRCSRYCSCVHVWRLYDGPIAQAMLPQRRCVNCHCGQVQTGDNAHEQAVSAPKDFRTWEQIQAEDLTLCAKDKPCVWTEDMDTLWESSCASNGGPFQFTDEGPTENHFAFCPYCGHPLLAVKYIETLREEEAQ